MGAYSSKGTYFERSVPTPDTSVLWYTNSDDGLWLKCSDCDFDVSLGFDPSINDVRKAWVKHKCKGE